MFQQDDLVVYASYGVCVVADNDARTATGGSDRAYYVLAPVNARLGTVYVPADREELIRPVINQEEALRIVEHYDEIAPDDFADTNARTVEAHFKGMLRRCDCLTAVRVAKTMGLRIADQERRKHLPSSLYTRLFDQAARQAESELAAALGISAEEVRGMMAGDTPAKR